MEVAPPSYDTTTTRDYWTIIAPSIPFSDICSAALVNSHWHSIFTPLIWGDPALYLQSTNNDRVHHHLNTFIQRLPKSRLFVRCMTHTLHFPPGQLELYDVSNTNWLRCVLGYLPSLQSLIVQAFSPFDHEAIRALTAAVEHTSLPVKLLDASRCLNVTYDTLGKALKFFDRLLYLELSFTPAARDARVLSSLFTLQGLKVLNLRHVNLRDQDLAVLINSIGRRVRSLDLRNNLLTDRGIDALVDHCFLNLVPNNHLRPESQECKGPSSSVSQDYEDYSNDVNGEFETSLFNTLTRGFITRLAIEDESTSGIRNLYMAGNPISLKGVSRLIKSRQLRVLDVGGDIKGIDRTSQPTSPPIGDTLDTIVCHFAMYAKRSLSFLRIHHAFITQHTSDPLTGKTTYLQPFMIPGVRKLVLTDVPLSSHSTLVSDHLKRFIEECAEESWQAFRQAPLDYTRPPEGHNRQAVLQQSARNKFALQLIVLEVVDHRRIHGFKSNAVNEQIASQSSVTGDTDSETLWAAAQEDFSFFGDNSREKDSRIGPHPIRQPSKGKEHDSRSAGPSMSQAERRDLSGQSYDTLEILGKFRRDCAERHKTVSADGFPTSQTKGYWPGVIQIIRK